MKGLKMIITLPYRIVEAAYSIASDILTVERPMVRTTHIYDIESQ